jgi:transcriptional regulator with XRE-family HTH domain
MKLSTYLDQHNMTPSDLARRIGVHSTTITRYISGARLATSPEVLRRIAKATDYQVLPNDFVFPDGLPKRSRRANGGVAQSGGATATRAR